MIKRVWDGAPLLKERNCSNILSKICNGFTINV
jgi:hypothetical protein